MCGASSQQKAAAANETKISDMLTTQLSEFAGNNLAMLREIQGNLTPIQAAGPEQFGFAPGEEAAMRTDATEQLSAAGSQTANAVRSALASKGGGTTYLPSGSEASILGALAQDNAVKQAEAQSGITQKGYDIGRSNWEFATEGLMKAPGELENPVTSAGGEAANAGKTAMEGANAVTAANQAWMQPVGAIVGGLAKGALAAGTGGASLAVPGLGLGDVSGSSEPGTAYS